MAAFNENLQGIANETRMLQAVHLTAKTRLREEEQKLRSLKAEIAEQTTNRDVGLFLPSDSINFADWQESYNAQLRVNKAKVCGSLTGL